MFQHLHYENDILLFFTDPLSRERKAGNIHFTHQEAKVKKGLIMLYESQISMLYAFNLFRAVCQFYLKKKWGWGKG